MKCPTCDSPAPHLHPSVQVGGEVSLCPDPFHEQVTPSNTKERIARVRSLCQWCRDEAEEVDGG